MIMGLSSIVIVLGVLIGAFEVWMIVDAALNDKISNKAKTWWIIGMILIHPFVAVIYFFTDRKRLS